MPSGISRSAPCGTTPLRSSAGNVSCAARARCARPRRRRLKGDLGTLCAWNVMRRRADGITATRDECRSRTRRRRRPGRAAATRRAPEAEDRRRRRPSPTSRSVVDTETKSTPVTIEVVDVLMGAPGLVVVVGLRRELLGEALERARQAARARPRSSSLARTVVWNVISVRPSPRSANVTVAIRPSARRTRAAPARRPRGRPPDRHLAAVGVGDDAQAERAAGPDVHRHLDVAACSSRACPTSGRAAPARTTPSTPARAGRRRPA